MSTRPPNKPDGYIPTTEERLWGHQVQTTLGLMEFKPPTDDGTTGVREPRNPRPSAPSAAFALPLPSA